MQWILRVCIVLDVFLAHKKKIKKILFNIHIYFHNKIMIHIFQQIAQYEARTVCHTYRCLLKKKKKNNNRWKKDKHEKYYKDLKFSVANAAKKLCLSILSYEGIVNIFYFVSYAQKRRQCLKV